MNPTITREDWESAFLLTTAALIDVPEGRTTRGDVSEWIAYVMRKPLADLTRK